MKDKDEIQDARIARQPFAVQGDLPRRATSQSERVLPDWDDVAEAVKMPGGVVMLTLLDGSAIAATHQEIKQIIETWVEQLKRARQKDSKSTGQL